LAAANAGILHGHSGYGQILSSHTIVHQEKAHIAPQHYDAAPLTHEDAYNSISYDNHGSNYDNYGSSYDSHGSNYENQDLHVSVIFINYKLYHFICLFITN